MSGYTEYRKARDFMLEHRTDYETAKAEFVWPDVGDSFNWAIDWFDTIAEGNDQTALWLVDTDGSEHKISYEQMRQRSNAAALWLRKAGVKQGDHVMIMLENQLELWELMLAVLKLGAVIMPTTTVLGFRELADRITRGEVAQVITNSHNIDKFVDIPGAYGKISTDGGAGWQDYSSAGIDNDTTVELTEPLSNVKSSDPSLIYFTSGTTSLPKMVEHSQVSYPVGHLSTLYWLGLKPGDVHQTISSPGWGKHAWSCFFTPWIAEATIFILNYTKFDAAHLDHELARAGVNTFCAPPTVWRMLLHLEHTEGPGQLRELLSAGEPLNPEVIDRIQDMWGLPIRDGYGQTETTALIANTPGQTVKAGSMGKPLPGVNIVLEDPATGEVIAPESATDSAEVCLELTPAPTNLMTRYIGDETREAISRRNGRFHTSDVAGRDEDGMISFVGRTDDVFKASDYKVSPFEVESILLKCPAVSESAVVGAPDDVRLNVVKAYIELAPGYLDEEQTAFDVLKFCREHLPPYERVRRIEFATLPKTISGKIRRVELREHEISAHEAGIRRKKEWREQDFPNLKKA